MENIFKGSNRVIATILTLGILLGFAGTYVYAVSEMPEANTVVTEEPAQELVPLMARGCGYTSVNQMQHLVVSGQAPSAVTAVHNGFQGQQPHVHFSDGTAMNFDGSAHHGNPNPSNTTMNWLNSHGWCLS